MQRFRALQGDYDVTICVPPLLGEVLLNAVGEEVGHPVLLTGEPCVVGGAQLHNVVIAGEQPSPGELADLQLGFPLQSLRDLLGNDLPTENAREAITDDAFEPALEALHEAHDNPLHANDSTDHRIWVNGPGHRPVPKWGAPLRKTLVRAC
ncbi:hypothetical protein GCM10009533_66470 [Saccharopolyspora spinosporotrichia]|uniref:Uncharacterized protein n=1 Tax=Saccharopolyspora erythraea TaxID=1836 RepID=A0ABP3P873_SACER